MAPQSGITRSLWYLHGLRTYASFKSMVVNDKASRNDQETATFLAIIEKRGVIWKISFIMSNPVKSVLY